MIPIFPQLLGLHPVSLERNCNFAMYMFTGQSKYRNPSIDDEDDDEDEDEEENIEDEFEVVSATILFVPTCSFVGL
jgi:hypothetical protein